jgi:hypothetical protein
MAELLEFAKEAGVAGLVLLIIAALVYIVYRLLPKDESTKPADVDVADVDVAVSIRELELKVARAEKHIGDLTAWFIEMRNKSEQTRIDVADIGGDVKVTRAHVEDIRARLDKNDTVVDGQMKEIRESLRRLENKFIK